MFIDKMQPSIGFEQVNKDKVEIQDGSTFKSILTDAVTDYVESENAVNEDINRIATGETNDTHNLMINAQKAELSLNFLVQIRNKALDSYNEIMRIGI